MINFILRGACRGANPACEKRLEADSGSRWYVPFAVMLGLWLGVVPISLVAEPDNAKPVAHTTRIVEGWTVHNDDGPVQTRVTWCVVSQSRLGL